MATTITQEPLGQKHLKPTSNADKSRAAIRPYLNTDKS